MCTVPHSALCLSRDPCLPHHRVGALAWGVIHPCKAKKEQRGGFCRGPEQWCFWLLMLVVQTAVFGKQRHEDQMDHLLPVQLFQVTFWRRQIFPSGDCLMESDHLRRREVMARRCLQQPALIPSSCPTWEWFSPCLQTTQLSSYTIFLLFPSEMSYLLFTRNHFLPSSHPPESLLEPDC